MVGLDVDHVTQGISILDSVPRGVDRTLKLVSDYATPDVSDKVGRIIHSDSDYVKRVVWRTNR